MTVPAPRPDEGDTGEKRRLIRQDFAPFGLMDLRQRLRCGEPLLGLYGAETTCARPFAHAPGHTVNDGIYNETEWLAFIDVLAAASGRSDDRD